MANDANNGAVDRELDATQGEASGTFAPFRHDPMQEVEGTDYRATMPFSVPAMQQTVDADPVDSFVAQADIAFQAGIGRFTGGLSPAALLEAYADWIIHLSLAPGKQTQLISKAARKWMRLNMAIAQSAWMSKSVKPCIEPLAQDTRFASPEWQFPPWSWYYQSFLLTQQWWHNATTTVPGVSKQHERILEFTSRQWLDLLAPSNFLLTNPAVLRLTVTSGGTNLLKGVVNAASDFERTIGGKPPAGAENYRPGIEVATTEGDVVFRSRLIELIQYRPSTPRVYAEPVLIVPAWIMKYYILDLSPSNSMIRHLVENGHTVFCISWRNPDSSDRDLSLDDYRELGVMRALDAIFAIRPSRKIQTIGYCLGGTLLAIAAAAMARDGDDRLASITLLAAQTDFTEPGELQLFIDESQVSFLESMMWHQGCLEGNQMSGAFQMLRSRDLIISRMINTYLMGNGRKLNDLMAWNTDGTRLPARMHSDYLRSMYLENALAKGSYKVDGRAISLKDIEVPMFIVGTERDHVAPWRSVYRVRSLTDVETTFVLTSGGHNAGIVSEPGHPRRHYRLQVLAGEAPYVDPDAYLQTTSPIEGSWWMPWLVWLDKHASSQIEAPNISGDDGTYSPLQGAPGSYVHLA